jgi:hypothetical protein
MSNKSKRQIERYALPNSVDGICALVRQVLEGGHVERLELDNNDAYVRAIRWVEHNDLEEPDVTWDGALRNMSSFLEYSSEGASPFQVVVDMTILASSKGLKAACWVTGIGGRDLLLQWFNLHERGMPTTAFRTMVGIEVTELKSLPPETLILCCSDITNAEPSELTLVIKTTIDLRGSHVEDSVEDVRADGRVGNHPQEHSPATYQLALNPRDLPRVPWKKGRQLGKE